MTIVSGLKIKARGRCLVRIKSSERLAKINDSSIIMLLLYICGKNQRLLCGSLLHQKGLCVHTPQHRILPSTSEISGRFPKTHLQRHTSFSRVSRTELGMCQNTLKISAVNGNMNASRWLWDPRLHAVRWHGGRMMCPQGDWHRRKKENHRFLSKNDPEKKYLTVSTNES